MAEPMILGDVEIESYSAYGLEDLLCRWLERKGSKELHRVAMGWNWDAGERMIVWILLNPLCSLATAQGIFAKCEPEYSVFGPGQTPQLMTSEISGYHAVGIEITKLIFRKYRANAFLNVEIGLDRHHRDNFDFMIGLYHQMARAVLSDTSEFCIPTGFDIAADSVPVSAYDNEGWPDELLDAYNTILSFGREIDAYNQCLHHCDNFCSGRAYGRFLHGLHESFAASPVDGFKVWKENDKYFCSHSSIPSPFILRAGSDSYVENADKLIPLFGSILRPKILEEIEAIKRRIDTVGFD
jgi:hypothetical protein